MQGCRAILLKRYQPTNVVPKRNDMDTPTGFFLNMVTLSGTAVSVIKTLFSLTRTKIKQNNCVPTWFFVKNNKSVFVASKVHVLY